MRNPCFPASLPAYMTYPKACQQKAAVVCGYLIPPLGNLSDQATLPRAHHRINLPPERLTLASLLCSAVLHFPQCYVKHAVSSDLPNKQKHVSRLTCLSLYAELSFFFFFWFERRSFKLSKLIRAHHIHQAARVQVLIKHGAVW